MSETLSYPNLIAGAFPRQTDKVIIAAGANLAAGAILGRISVAAAAAAALVPGVGNIGDGAPGAVALGAAAKVGTYRLLCLAGASDVAHVAVEDLGAGADIAARPLWVAPAACELVSIGILTAGAPAGVDDANTAVVAIADDAANAIVTKTYNTANQPPTADFASLGALDATHKVLAAGEHITLAVTNGATANLPAFEVVIVYRLAGTAGNTGTFAVIDPEGYRLEDLTVGSAYLNSHFGLTIADGAADFVAGDIFTFAVTQAAGTGKYALCDKTAVDGSQDPVAVLAEAAPAALADQYAVIYLTGCFNGGAVSLAVGTTLADVKAALQQRGIYLVTADNNVHI